MAAANENNNRRNCTMKNEKTYELVLTALFTAIIVIMAFTPLGYIPLVVINAAECSQECSILLNLIN